MPCKARAWIDPGVRRLRRFESSMYASGSCASFASALAARICTLVGCVVLDGRDVRYGEIVACWAQLSPVERCGFETWYRVNFGSDSVRREMDVPDTEIIDALPQ